MGKQWKHIRNIDQDPATGPFSLPLCLPNIDSGTESSNTTTGQSYYDTDNNRVRMYINGAWATVSTSAGAGDNTLDEAYDQGGAGSGRTITADSGAVAITVSNTSNNAALTLTQNDTTNNPAALTFSNTGTGNDVTGTSSLWACTPTGTVRATAFDSVSATTLTIGSTNATALTLSPATTVSGALTCSSTLGVTGTATFAGITQTGGNLSMTCSNTTGSGLSAGFSFDGTTVTSGDVFNIEYDATNMSGGSAFKITEDTVAVLTVAENGNTTWVGTASTDVLTVTAGDIQITAGDIDMDAGIITIDNTADEGNKIARNNATGTAPVLEVEQTHTTGGVAFLVDQDATGDVNAVEITNAGTGYAVTTTAAAAGGEGYEYIAAASGTGIGFFADGATGSWVGAATTGLIQATSDGTLASTSASLCRIAFSGTSASGGAGTCLRLEDTSTSGGGTEYALYISSTNSEAVHVDAGQCLFDELTTHGGGITVNDSQTLTVGSTAGTTFSFNGTTDLDIDGGAANDQIIIGSNTDTDLLWHGTSGVALTCDSSGNSLTVSASATLKVTGDGAGTGLVIPFHATASPTGVTQGSIFFEVDANKLWVYNGTGWVGTVLA